jgi:hypothetical protein
MNSQTSLFDEARARRTDPETSREAAASVRSLRMSQSYILRILRDVGPMTDEGLVGWVDPNLMSPSGTRTRRSELVAKGLVEWTGRKIKMSTGRMAREWRAV